MHIVDTLLGIEDGYPVGLRRLAVYTGAGNAFALASKHLETYCGLNISHMTVRKLCKQEAPKIDAWYQKSLEVQRNFIHAPGNVEATMGKLLDTSKIAQKYFYAPFFNRKSGPSGTTTQFANLR